MEEMQTQLKKIKKPKTGYSSISLRKSPIFKQSDEEEEETKVVTKEDFELLAVIGRGAAGKVNHLLMVMIGEGEIFAMKVIRKDKIIARSQALHCQAEKDILTKVEHPFIVKLHYAFQTSEKLYLILDFVNGGELFHHLKKESIFSIKRATFYAAELVSALTHLHSLNIIYRDLKPENILLDANGHIIVTDFGIAKEISDRRERTSTICGTPEYLAPEILRGETYGKTVDWFALGNLIYEMLFGTPPFYSESIAQMYQKILHEEVSFHPETDERTISLLSGLLQKDPEKRLGSKCVEEIRNHPFFSDIDWEKLEKREIEPPFKPSVNGDVDLSQIDSEFTTETPRDSVVLNPSTKENGITFNNFSYALRKKKPKQTLIEALENSNAHFSDTQSPVAQFDINSPIIHRRPSLQHALIHSPAVDFAKLREDLLSDINKHDEPRIALESPKVDEIPKKVELPIIQLPSITNGVASQPKPESIKQVPSRQPSFLEVVIPTNQLEQSIVDLENYETAARYKKISRERTNETNLRSSYSDHFGELSSLAKQTNISTSYEPSNDIAEKNGETCSRCGSNPSLSKRLALEVYHLGRRIVEKEEKIKKMKNGGFSSHQEQTNCSMLQAVEKEVIESVSKFKKTIGDQRKRIEQLETINFQKDRLIGELEQELKGYRTSIEDQKVAVEKQQQKFQQMEEERRKWLVKLLEVCSSDA